LAAFVVVAEPECESGTACRRVPEWLEIPNQGDVESQGDCRRITREMDLHAHKTIYLLAIPGNCWLYWVNGTSGYTSSTFA
jgi:hypothetical protein